MNKKLFKKVLTAVLTAALLLTSNGVASLNASAAEDEKILVEGVYTNFQKATMATQTTRQINAYVEPSDATNQSLRYRSSASEVAKVSATGLITALSPGKATITVSALDGSRQIETIKITVLNDLTITNKNVDSDNEVIVLDQILGNLYIDSSVGDADIYLGGVTVRNILALDSGDYTLYMYDSKAKELKIDEIAGEIESFATGEEDKKAPSLVLGENTTINDLNARISASIRQEDGSAIEGLRVTQTADGKITVYLENYNGGLLLDATSGDLEIITTGCNLTNVNVSGNENAGNVVLTDGGDSEIANLTVSGAANVNLGLPATEVNIDRNAKGASFSSTNSIGTLRNAGNGSNITISGEVNSLEANGEGARINVAAGGYVGTANLNGAGSTLFGAGDVSEANINGNNISVDTVNTLVTVGPVTGARVQGSDASPDSTVATRPIAGGGGGGGDGITPPEVPLKAGDIIVDNDFEDGKNGLTFKHGGVEKTAFVDGGNGSAKALKVSDRGQTYHGVGFDFAAFLKKNVTVRIKFDIKCAVAPTEGNELKATMKTAGAPSNYHTIAKLDTGDADTWYTLEGTFDLTNNITAAQLYIEAPGTNDYYLDNVKITVDRIGDPIAITGISIDETAVVIQGKTHNLIATIEPETFTTSGVITWTSDDETVATVDDNGKVTGVGPGKAVITATTAIDGVSATAHSDTCTVTVVEPSGDVKPYFNEFDLASEPEAFSLKQGTNSWDPANTTTDKAFYLNGDNFKNKASGSGITDKNLLNKFTKWEGIYEVVKGFEYTVTVTGGKSKEAGTNIKAELIVQNEKTLNNYNGSFKVVQHDLGVEEISPETPITFTKQFLLGEQTWNADDVLIVKAALRFTGIDESTTMTGTVNIKVLANEGSIIPVPITGITLNETSLTLSQGASELLIATIEPDDFSTSNVITWTSDKPEVATVDETGEVTAVGPGEATITAATAIDGASTTSYTATCDVEVTADVELTLNRKLVVISNLTENPVLTVNVANPITWTSSNTGVVTVANGKLTPIANGTAVITAKVTGTDKEVTCNVKVDTKAEVYDSFESGSTIITISQDCGTVVDTEAYDGKYSLLIQAKNDYSGPQFVFDNSAGSDKHIFKFEAYVKSYNTNPTPIRYSTTYTTTVDGVTSDISYNQVATKTTTNEWALFEGTVTVNPGVNMTVKLAPQNGKSGNYYVDSWYVTKLEVPDEPTIPGGKIILSHGFEDGTLGGLKGTLDTGLTIIDGGHNGSPKALKVELPGKGWGNPGLDLMPYKGKTVTIIGYMKHEQAEARGLAATIQYQVKDEAYENAFITGEPGEWTKVLLEFAIPTDTSKANFYFDKKFDETDETVPTFFLDNVLIYEGAKEDAEAEYTKLFPVGSSEQLLFSADFEDSNNPFTAWSSTEDGPIQNGGVVGVTGSAIGFVLEIDATKEAEFRDSRGIGYYFATAGTYRIEAKVKNAEAVSGTYIRLQEQKSYQNINSKSFEINNDEWYQLDETFTVEAGTKVILAPHYSNPAYNFYVDDYKVYKKLK